jgi:uncharacterized protein (DUF433 family)
MPRATQYTAAEAAFVLREPVRAVKKALDAGPVRPVLRRTSGRPVRVIDWSDLFYLYVAKELREELTAKARGALYDELRKSLKARSDAVRIGPLHIALADLEREAASRARALAKLAESVEFSGDGEPVLAGTGVEVHRIAALLDGGLSVDEVLSDYPSLTREAVETARTYAAVHPKAGRPYPRTTAKRALRAADLDALDDVLGDPAE